MADLVAWCQVLGSQKMVHNLHISFFIFTLQSLKVSSQIIVEFTPIWPSIFIAANPKLELLPSAVLLSPPQIPAGLKGFLGIPEDSSGVHYNFSDFELEEKISVKSSGILWTGTEFGRISAKLEYTVDSLITHGSHTPYSLKGIKFTQKLSKTAWETVRYCFVNKR